MDILKSISLLGYKSYNELNINMEYPINILIGRNNSGKSSVIDILEFFTNENIFFREKDNINKIKFSIKLENEHIEGIFQSNTTGGAITGNHYTYASEFIGREIVLELDANYNLHYNQKIVFNVKLSDENDFVDMHNSQLRSYWERVAEKIGNPFSKMEIIKISSERDIRKEEDLEPIICKNNGEGATNIIHKYINSSKLDSKKVEKDILNALNKIVWPDSQFTDIVVQQVKENELIYWEIFLEENDRRIPLSQCGSGLKTIILVLIKLFLQPDLNQISNSNIIYAFEELENNLHPHLQRNLFSFVIEWINERGGKLFLTTHSNVAITMFSELDNVQLLHVSKMNGISSVSSITSHIKKSSIIDDLGNKASDILQSNGIIWVEGPSDRLYLNKWINAVSNGQLKEHIHYQIMFYGGRLLSHLTLEEVNKDASNETLINLLLMNRNSIIIIDSDIKNESQDINATKKRIKEKYDENESICWITYGKEIENYVPKSVIDQVFNLEDNNEFDRYTTIIDYLNDKTEGLGYRFEKKKVKYAKLFLEVMNITEINQVYDLKDKLDSIVNEIKKWNNLI